MRLHLLAALLVLGCAPSEPEEEVRFGRTGSSIALLEGGELAVVNPDQGSVSLLDAVSLEPRATVDVGGEPHALLVTHGLVLVATYRTGEVVAIDPARAEAVARRRVCAGPYGLTTPPSEAWIGVACEWDGRVLALDPRTLEPRELASGLSRPRAILAEERAVHVAEHVGGQVARIDLGGAVTRSSLVPERDDERPAIAGMTANVATAIASAGRRLFVAHELVNHTGETARERVASDYGTVVDGNPKINPAVSALPAGGPVLYARFDAGARIFNAPSALAAFGDRALLVAHLSTANVALLDVAATRVDGRVLASFPVGAGPRGIAVDEARKMAYVDNAFDASVSRIDLADLARAPVTRRRDLPQPFSARALAGRKIFHDASNPHVTPSGVVACSTCHPDGGDDGLVWFMETDRIPRKRRRTPHLANARSSEAPFHWDGEFRSMGDLVQGTVRNLMAGDGLLVDGDAVQAYIDEIVKAPLPPPGDAASIGRGKVVFDAGCATCHRGTDGTDNERHVVRDPAAERLAAPFTPGLGGLFLRAPYFHDGAAPTLDATLDHGPQRGLSADDRRDLVAYLETR